MCLSVTKCSYQTSNKNRIRQSLLRMVSFSRSSPSQFQFCAVKCSLHNKQREACYLTEILISFCVPTLPSLSERKQVLVVLHSKTANDCSALLCWKPEIKLGLLCLKIRLYEHFKTKNLRFTHNLLWSACHYKSCD